MFGFGDDEEEKEKTLEQLRAEASEGKGVQDYIGMGLAGLGDAITSAYGTKATGFLKSAKDEIGADQKRKQLALTLAEKKQSDQKVASAKEIEAKEKRAYLKELLDLKRNASSESNADRDADRELRRESNRLAAETRDAMRSQSRSDREERFSYQKEKDSQTRQAASDRLIENDTEKFGKEVAGVSDVVSAIKKVEKNLGFRLDDAKFDENNELMAKGEKVDLPGVSLPGIGRLSAYSGDARELNNAVSSIFNQELKDRSGAAISNNEMARLKDEFAQGKYSTEAEMVKALKDYKRATAAAIRTHEARFRPEAVSRFKERGGMTSDDIMPMKNKTAAAVVRRQTADGRVAIFDGNSKQFLGYEDEAVVQK